MSKTGRSKEANPSRWWLVLVVLFAAALRFWQLDTLPPGLHPDEAEFGLAVLVDDPIGLPQMIASVFMRWSGATPWALRASSAVAGVLLVWGTYVAAAALLPVAPKKTNWMPLAAAFTTAIFYPALSLSRFGTGFPWATTFSVLAVACFWQGLNHHSSPVEPEPKRRHSAWPVWWQRFTLSPLTYFALTGVLWGAAAYGQMGVGLFLLLAFGFVLWRAEPSSPTLLPVRAKGAFPFPTGERARVRGIAVSFASGVVVLAFFSIIWGWPFGSEEVHSPSFAGFSQILAGLFWSGSAELAYNLPGRPFLDGVQAILLLMGLGITVRQGRERRHLFLLLWAGVALLPALLTEGKNGWPLLLAAAAPLAILIAMGLSWLSEQLPVISQPLLRRPLPTARWSLLPVYCLLLTSAFLTTRAYFTTYAQQPQLAQAFAVDEWQLGQSAAAYPPETLLYLIPPLPERATVQFALRSRQRLWSFTGNNSLLPVGRLSTPVLYLVRADQTEMLNQLTTFFPEATFSATPLINYRTVYVPAVMPRLPGHNPTDRALGGEMALVDWDMVLTDTGTQITAYWQALTSPRQDYAVYVRYQNEDDSSIATTELVLNGYPTSQWHEQEIFVTTLTLSQPVTEISGGELVVGFYVPATGQRLGEITLWDWP